MILDGRALAAAMLERCRERVRKLVDAGIVPRLDVIRVGDDPASKVYVGVKERAAASIGVIGQVHACPASTGEAELLARITALNDDPAVHGILVQLPLPGGIDPSRVADCVRRDKDIDGLHPGNLGRLVRGTGLFEPCTPSGVIRLLDESGVQIAGRHAVVVGRSDIVGKPMALMLVRRDATVTICHSRTPDLAAHTRLADILIVAAGRPRLISGDMVKVGAAVIDVGVNRLPDGSLAGDVDFDSVRPVASYLTPVPGGVGPLTVSMLIENTVTAAERASRAGSQAR